MSGELGDSGAGAASLSRIGGPGGCVPGRAQCGERSCEEEGRQQRVLGVLCSWEKGGGLLCAWECRRCARMGDARRAEESPPPVPPFLGNSR